MTRRCELIVLLVTVVALLLAYSQLRRDHAAFERLWRDGDVLYSPTLAEKTVP